MQEIEKELKNVETVEYAIKRMYLYPSYAYVELGSKLQQLVANAREVRLGEEPNTIVIDNVTYNVWVEDDISVTYWDYGEEEEENVEATIKEEVERLEKQFRELESNELVAILENSNSDFYVFALILLTKEE